MKKSILALSLLAAAMAHAGGFRVSLQGVRQFAMAHTSAHADDASVGFYNPAGISFIPSKLSLAAGGFGVFSKINYQNTSTLQSFDTDNPVGTPLYAAAAYKISDKFSVGFSFTTPFGSTVQYPEDWSGRELVQKLALKAMYFQPMISLKLADWASVGVSYIYATGSVDWDKAATNLGGTLNIKDEKAKGHGMGLGFYLRPTDKLDVSLAYRSPVDMKADKGTATFNISPALYNGLKLVDGKDAFTAVLPLVEEYTIGATYHVTPSWLISADFNYSGWSRYNQLKLDFANAPVGNQVDNTVLITPKNFKNTRTFRIGTEYMFNEMFAGRIGYYYDEAVYDTQFFTPETPSFDANVITAGFGVKVRGFGIDFAAGKSFPKYRTFNNIATRFSGQAKASSAYVGLGVTYNLK